MAGDPRAHPGRSDAIVEPREHLKCLQMLDFLPAELLHRTQEAAGSSPASSIAGRACSWATPAHGGCA
jgi:hypothetical protein